MNSCVVTEGNFDGMLLARLIADEQERYNVEISGGGGKSAVFSFARTLLAVRRIPVAVVIDADSPEQDAALECQRDAEEVNGDAAAGLPLRVLVAVPELEILFFHRPELLRRVYSLWGGRERASDGTGPTEPAPRSPETRPGQAV